MKKLALTLLLASTFGQSGCTVLRYQFEPALNSVPKDATIVRLTNDYIEYCKYSTNIYQSTNVVPITYRAYYSTDGRIYETKVVK